MLIDLSADYLGIWHKQKVNYKEDFSIFLLWVNEPYCIDNLGRAEITDWKRENGKLIFTKTYDESETNVTIRNPVYYEGNIIKNIPETYKGTWVIDKKPEIKGGFSLCEMNENIRKILADCDISNLNKKILEKKNFDIFLE